MSISIKFVNESLVWHSPTTVSVYRSHLKKFQKFLEVNGESLDNPLNTDITQKYFDHLYTQGLGESYIRQAFNVIRMFAKWSSQEHVISCFRPKVKYRNKHKLLSQKDLFLIFENALKSGNKRDTAVLALLLGCGLRLSELVNLNVGDVTEENILIRTRPTRTFPLVGRIKTIIQDCLSERPCCEPDEPLFTNKQGKRITSHSVQRIVRSLGGCSFFEIRRSVTAEMYKIKPILVQPVVNSNLYLTPNNTETL